MGERDPMPPSERPQRVRGELVVDVSRMPEMLALMRCEMANILREAAQDEAPEIAEFANRVAAEFEAGQGHGQG